jgi:hypothetical protein
MARLEATSLLRQPLPQEDSVDANEGPMPKRLRENKQTLGEDNPKRGDTARPASKADIIPSIKREFILTPLADESLHDAIRVISKATGTSLSNSHFLRVLLKVVEHAMQELEREVSRLGRLERPGNARTSQLEREEFEHQFAGAVVAALRKAGPYDTDSED